MAVIVGLAAVPVLTAGEGGPRPDALVAAGDTDVTLQVTPKWLPEAVVTRTYADANLAEGVRTISYDFGGGAGGILLRGAAHEHETVGQGLDRADGDAERGAGRRARAARR